MAKGLLKQTLDAIFDHVTFDSKLANKLEDFVIEYVTRNSENQGFFGGNLVGVHRPLFTPDDVDRICNGIFKVDPFEARKKLLAINTIDPKTGKSVKLVNPEFKVASTEFYHLMMYACHRFLTCSAKADVQTKGATFAIMCFQIRALTSKIHNDFQYKADEEMALAVNMSLSKKYSIKNFGTWYEVMMNRAVTVIDPHKGVHYKDIISYDNDKEVFDAITDTQGRMKDLIVSQWSVIREVIDNDKRVMSQKSTINVDGETIIRDLVRSKSDYLSYILSIVMSEADFIRDDLLTHICGLMISPKLESVKKTLYTLVNLANEDRDGAIEKFVRETAIYAYDILYAEFGNSNAKVRLPMILISMRGKLMASKGKEAELMYLRNEGDRITYLALRSTNKALIASVRTTMLLYIVARMMLKGKL